MITATWMLLVAQAPAPQDPPAPVPEPAPAAQEPAPKAPSRTRDDRLEGRISGEARPAPAVEAPPAGPPPTDLAAQGWKPLNRPALIVNEEMVTMLPIQRAVEQSRRGQTGPFNAKEAIENEVVNRTRQMLWIQGGKDLGYDPEAVERMVDREMAGQVEEAGGVTKLAASLKDLDQDSFARRDEAYAYINTSLWQQSVTGQAPGPGGRVYRDRFARPGRVLFEARESREQEAKNPKVVMTQLIIQLGDPVAPGAEKRIQGQLADLRERVLQGEDMGELADQYGSLGKSQVPRGVSRPIPLSSLRATNPEAARFVEQAKVGDLSPVMPYLQDGKLAGYMVLRPDEIVAPKLPAFEDPKAQRVWMENHLGRLDLMRTQIGLVELLNAAYVWPPQTFATPEGR